MEITQQNPVQEVFNPRKFIIWLIIISSLMAFAGLCSAFIVMRYDVNNPWASLELPSLFKVSTLVVLVSSVSIQLGYSMAKKKNMSNAKLMVALTFVLGILFTYFQMKSFGQLVAMGKYAMGSESTSSSSFVYIFATVHLLHLLVTMFVLILLLIKSFQETKYERHLITFHNSVVFWHFLGVLWVCLYLFLYIYI